MTTAARLRMARSKSRSPCCSTTLLAVLCRSPATKDRNGDAAPGRAARVSRRCGASRGTGRRRSGMGSTRARRHSRPGTVPLSRRAPAEIEPRRGVDADDVAAEGRVSGEEGQDLFLRAPGFEPQGQRRFLQLLEICPLPVFPGQADDLHGDRARPALDFSVPEVLTHGPNDGQGVDARAELEPLVLEADEDLEEALGDALSRREAPLAGRRRPGPEELAAGAEEHRRYGVGEADDGQGKPYKDNENNTSGT